MLEQWSSSQSLNYNVHVCAQFLQTNDLASKFCVDDCFAVRSGQERSTNNPGTACPFTSLLDPFQINIKAFFRTICCFPKNEISAVSLNSAPFRISAVPLRTVCTRKLNIAEPFSYLIFFSVTKKSSKVCQSDNCFWLFRLLSRGWGKEYSGKRNSKKGGGGEEAGPLTHNSPYLPLHSKLIPTGNSSQALSTVGYVWPIRSSISLVISQQILDWLHVTWHTFMLPKILLNSERVSMSTQLSSQGL